MAARLIPTALLLLAACAGPAMVPSPPDRPSSVDRLGGIHPLSEFRIGISTAPFAIARGSDGAMWFTEEGAGKIGRIDVHGNVRHYRLSSRAAQPQGITAGHDGALYFAEHGGRPYATHIGRIEVDGRVTEWNDNNYLPQGVAPGPNGTTWFTQSCGGLAVLSHGKVTQYVVTGNPGETPAIVRGPDGALWFAEDGTARIGRIDASGRLKIFPGLMYEDKYNDIPNGVTIGPDGNLWWTAIASDVIWATNMRGRIVHRYAIPTPGAQPWGIVAGRDGALWFTEWGGNKIGRVTTRGQFREFALTTPGAKPQGIAQARDGSLWFAESAANKIGRLAP